MEQAIRDALRVLWGRSEDPVCAVNSAMEPVWAPDARAQKYLLRLSAQLSASAEMPTPVIPTDGNVIFSDTDGNAVTCSIRLIPASAEPLYLLIFRTQRELSGFSPAEARAMLSSQANAGHTVAAQFIQSLHFLKEAHPELADSMEAQKWLILADRACYTLLNSTVRCEEMLWYGGYCSGINNAAEAIDIREQIQSFADEIDSITGSNLTLADSYLEYGLYTRVDPERLSIALLLMFITTQHGDPNLRSMRLSAVRTDDVIRITMTFTADDTAGESLLHPSRSIDISLSGDEMLLSSFCAAFGASLSCQRLEGYSSAVMELHAEEHAADEKIMLGSPPSSYAAGRFSLSRVHVSEILDPEDFAPLN